MTPPTWEWLLSKSKVDKNTDCIEWQGCLSSGYGCTTIGGDIHARVHRLAYQFKVGSIPIGLFVCHRCDNKLCINPEHLFLGTTQDNMRDRDEKNRQAKGERITNSKLTESEIREIRKSTETNVSDANKYGVSASAISYVKNRQTWKHVV